jgi:hypothetical protein
LVPFLDSIDDGIFQWFDTVEIDEFSRAIAAELVKRAPRSPGRTRRKTAKRRETRIRRFSCAEQFARTHKLNI